MSHPRSARGVLLRLKFNLVLLAIFVLSLAGAGVYYYRFLEQGAFGDVRHDSQVMMETALAIRSYTTDQIKPHLDPLNADRFLPQTVPAFAAVETLRRLSGRYPGFEYREAALDPTNPRDRATTWEAGLIEQLATAQAKAPRDEVELSGVHGTGVARAMYVARPITISDPSCLSCHGDPALAPPSMQKVYGRNGGYGWQMGQTIGMQIVKVPMLYPLEKARSTFYSFMLSLVAVFGLMFLGLNLALSAMVIEPMARLNRRLEELATTDFLTDLVNRRRFFERLAAEMADARVHGTSLSVVMFDLDFFKRINDTFGHDSGDRVLKHTAVRIRELLRSSDCAARFGGEEFMILLRETPIDAAMALAEAVRAKIADAPFEVVGTVSASFGVAEWNHDEDAHALINRADRALYQAKDRGRNRVVRASDAPVQRVLVPMEGSEGI
ncbi:sensor domain-containing diguanylate cyclase [Denitromonas iodatirespirans]|uniref:diguanylate cyclase n=1 Tax=Denitromonas iodatirespirans TaxID=2795389 RepID=A0A944DGE9_DENI1|nr:diguanylate cyclase [Denitromonas iodatirespirans]MBT0962373.1 diguanylate cyclase [Denitromonas iodatirespirans]